MALDGKEKKEFTAIKAISAHLPKVKEVEQQVAVRPETLSTQETNSLRTEAQASHESSSKESKEQSNSIRVLLVDDHILMREGLIQLFSLEADIQVVGEASDGFEALKKITVLDVDAVLRHMLSLKAPLPDGCKNP